MKKLFLTISVVIYICCMWRRRLWSSTGGGGPNTPGIQQEIS